VFAIPSIAVDSKLQRQYFQAPTIRAFPLSGDYGPSLSLSLYLSLLTVVGAAPCRYAATQTVRSELINEAHAARPQHAAGRTP
jgi:hypothetical protein